MRSRPKCLVNNIEELPEGLSEKHRNVTLVKDIMYIYEIPFVMTVSKRIHFGILDSLKT